MNALTPSDLGPRSTLLVDKHAAYIASFSRIWEEADKLEHVATEHFWMSGMYWGLTAMDLLGRLHEMDTAKILDWILSCYHPEDGGFGASPRNDSHLLSTLSALQILALLDELHRVDADRVAAYISGLQQPDGAFAGDKWGEIDTRFTYCALLGCSILGCLDVLDVPAAVDFVVACKNFDGGFGCTPGRLHWIDQAALSKFILYCQDEDDGGISDRPDDMADVYHTFFGIAGLSLLGYEGLRQIDPTYALPVKTVERIMQRQQQHLQA